jgi:DNA-binding protein HU-beta
MNKKDLINKVATAAGIPAVRARVIVDHIFDTVADALIKGEKVVISDFGTFTLSVRKPFQGRNPRTGEVIEIPAKRIPVFRTGRGLKNALNNSEV